MAIEEPKYERKCPEDIPEHKSSAPDGGYAWVILFVAFFTRMIMNGVYVCFALYTKDFVKEFNASPSVMSWMIAMYSGIKLLVAPIASILEARYGSRIVSVVSLSVAGLAYPAVYFYPTLWFNILTASIIVPICNGFSLMCTSIILTTYFDKRLCIAMGIYSCGAASSSFVVLPLVALLIDTFGWRLSKVFYSILYIFAALSAIAFRPLSSKSVYENVQETKDEESKYRVEKAETAVVSKETSIHNFMSLANMSSNLPNNEEPQSHINSLPNIGANNGDLDKCEGNILNDPISAPIGIREDSKLNLNSILERSITNDKEIVIEEEKEAKSEVKKPSGYLDLLKNPIFVLFLVSNLFTNLGYDTPYLYTKDKGLELGFSNSQATFALTCLGIGNLIGRLVLGFLGAHERINTYLLNAGGLVLAGAFVLLSRVAFSYALMITYAIGYGIFMGGNMTLAQVLLVDLLDLSDFSKSLSLLFIMQAIGLLSGAPISGVIFDLTKSFDWPFISCGLIILGSGSILLLAYFSKNFRESQKRK